MKMIFGLFFVLNFVNGVASKAEEPLCNDLLTGLSYEVKVSIQELARLRFDLDQRLTQGLNDSITRALMAVFEKKRIELIEASKLDQDALSSIIRIEIQKFQQRSETDTAHQKKIREEQAKEVIGSETKINKIGDLIEARAWGAQSILSNDQVLVSGGRGMTGVRFSSIERIDPNTGKSEKIGDLIQARENHTQSVLSGDRLLIVGGYHALKGKLSSVEVFNPTTKTSETIGHLLEARVNHAQSVLPDGRVLIVGGEGSGILSSVEVFDPRTGKSEKIGDLNERRKYHEQSLLPDGRVLVSGGFAEDSYGSGVYLSSIEVIDPTTGNIEKFGDLKESRSGHAQSVLPDGRVLVSGGIGRNSRGLGEIRSSVEVIDLSTGKIEKIGDLLEAREEHTQSVLPDGRVLVLGGNGKSVQLRLIELFDPNTGTSEKIGELNETKQAHCHSVLSTGQVVVTGGYKSGTVSTIELIQVGRK